MTATMIKMDNGFFIPKIDGYESKTDVIDINIEIIKDDYENLYKKQMIDAVTEHYEKKRKNQIESNIDPKIVSEFRKKHNLPKTLESFLGQS